MPTPTSYSHAGFQRAVLARAESRPEARMGDRAGSTFRRGRIAAAETGAPDLFLVEVFDDLNRVQATLRQISVWPPGSPAGPGDDVWLVYDDLRPERPLILSGTADPLGVWQTWTEYGRWGIVTD